ncbi:hypothetical protein IMG5_160920, partial [Ichthyophthirius multifiliis]
KKIKQIKMQNNIEIQNISNFNVLSQKLQGENQILSFFLRRFACEKLNELYKQKKAQNDSQQKQFCDILKKWLQELEITKQSLGQQLFSIEKNKQQVIQYITTNIYNKAQQQFQNQEYINDTIQNFFMAQKCFEMLQTFGPLGNDIIQLINDCQQKQNQIQNFIQNPHLIQQKPQIKDSISFSTQQQLQQVNFSNFQNPQVQSQNNNCQQNINNQNFNDQVIGSNQNIQVHQDSIQSKLAMSQITKHDNESINRILKYNQEKGIYLQTPKQTQVGQTQQPQFVQDSKVSQQQNNQIVSIFHNKQIQPPLIPLNNDFSVQSDNITSGGDINFQSQKMKNFENDNFGTPGFDISMGQQKDIIQLQEEQKKRQLMQQQQLELQKQQEVQNQLELQKQQEIQKQQQLQKQLQNLKVQNEANEIVKVGIKGTGVIKSKAIKLCENAISQVNQYNLEKGKQLIKEAIDCLENIQIKNQ